MNNSIIIAYPTGSAYQLTVLYAIERTDGMQTINCCVEGSTFPLWLQLRKFSIVSLEKRGAYTTLFNEINNSKNMDTSLFIDLVYSSIMELKHLNFS